MTTTPLNKQMATALNIGKGRSILKETSYIL
jgi:hypothetical protein